MRFSIILLFLIIQNIATGQNENWIQVCDTITNEQVWIEQSNQVQDCCWFWDGTNFVKRETEDGEIDCSNLGSCTGDDKLEFEKMCIIEDVEVTIDNGTASDCDHGNGSLQIGDEYCFDFSPTTTVGEIDVPVPSWANSVTEENGLFTLCYNLTSLNDVNIPFEINVVENGHLLGTITAGTCSGGNNEITINTTLPVCQLVCINQDKEIADLNGNPIPEENICDDNDCKGDYETEQQELELIKICILEDAENGILGQKWDNTDGDDTDGNGATDWLPNSQVFVNGEHINGAPSTSVTITDNWNLNDADFGVNVGNDVHSQERYCAYLNITEPMLLRDNNGNWGEYLNVFIQDCNKDMVEVVNKYTPADDSSAGEFFELCEGIRKIEIQINDYSVFGGFNLQYSTDGANTWTTFPMTETYTYQPKVSEIYVNIDEDGNLFYLDGSPFDGKQIECNTPCYPMTREELPDTEVSIINGCLDVDGDPANYIPVTQEVIFSGGEQQSATFYQNYGNEDTEVVIEQGENSFVDCATGEPIDEPVVPVECEFTTIVTATAPIGDNGVNVWKWDTLEGEYTAQTQAEDVFNGAIDGTGTPAINEQEGEGVYEKQNDLFIRDINAQNAYKYQTFFYTTEPVLIREFHGTAESMDYYLGECNTSTTLTGSGEYLNNTLPNGSEASLSAGIHEIAGTVYDFSVWGFTNYWQSFDNGQTWSRIPASQLYCKEPIIQECQVQLCEKENGEKLLTDIESCLPLGPEFTLKPPQLCSGEISLAPPVQCELTTFWKVNLGEVGTVEQKWTTSAVSTTTAAGHSYKDAFTATGTDGLPTHPKVADITISSTIASTTNVLNDDSPVVDDQAQSDFWIYLPTDATLEEFNATAEASGVWISDKCGLGNLREVLDAPYLNSTANNLGAYSSGWYKVRLYHHDVTANGITRLRADFGNGFENIPAYLTAPTVELVKEWVCNDTDIKEFIEENGYLCEDPRCEEARVSSSTPLCVNGVLKLVQTFTDGTIQTVDPPAGTYDNCSSCAEECQEGQIYTLLSKCELENGSLCDVAAPEGTIQVASNLVGTHPSGSDEGANVGNWNAYSVCATELPPISGNLHYWLEGEISSFTTIESYTTVNPDPTCCEE